MDGTMAAADVDPPPSMKEAQQMMLQLPLDVQGEMQTYSTGVM